MAVLTIRGVRSYGADKDVRIDLSNKVTLIYGQNGSGKSTISNIRMKRMLPRESGRVGPTQSFNNN